LIDPLFARARREVVTHPVQPSPQPSPTGAPVIAPTPTQSAAPSTDGPITTAFPGLTTFRGNASRSFYGEGPIPKHPTVLWRYPSSGGLCGQSSDQEGKRLWCGTGWTGQPNVVVGKKGKIEIRIGAYDGHYHFLDGKTGQPTRPDLVTGDLAKGSATTDPDGYPLYYAGSRDNLFRIVALDRPTPTVLWSIDANTTVQGGDISKVLQGGTGYRRVFRFWNGDETDASVVVDDQGYLYVARHASVNVKTRSQVRDHQVGSLMKLDPRKPKKPIVWSVQIGDFRPDGGILSTPALHEGAVYVMDTAGAIVAVNQ